MFKGFRSFLKAVYLFPFAIMMGNIAAGEEGAAATEVVEEVKPLSPEELEHQAAVARGDVLEVPEDEAIDPDLLAEIAGEPEAPAVVEAKKDDGVIPRARFNEVNEENKQLKAQLEAALKGAPAAAAEHPATVVEQTAAVVDPREKIKEMRRQQKDLELEGDVEAANQVGDQIDELILQVATSRATTTLKQETQATNVQNSLAEVAAVAYAQYPFLDVDSPDVDPDAVNAVIIRRNELIDAGKSAVEALQKAVDEKGPKFARLLGVSLTTTQSTAEQIREARETAAKAKGAEASLLQPPVLPSKTEKEGFAVNVADLTPAQIKAMPEEQKAKLRGDTV